MLKIVPITSNNTFDALQSDWQRLTAQPRYKGLFNSWHWNRLWWQYYAHLGDLHILTVLDDNIVRAIAPFYVTTTTALRFHSVKTLRFIGSGGDTSPDDLDVLLDDSNQQAVVKELCTHLTQMTEIKRYELKDLPEGSAFLHEFLTMAHSKELPEVQLVNESRLTATLPGSTVDYMKQLSRNTRKHWKRRQRNLDKAGLAKFYLCQTPDEVHSTLDRLIKLHHSRRNSKNDTGSFNSLTYINFHRELMLQLLQRGELRLLSLTLDDQIIAIEYAFAVDGILNFFQTGFDPSFEHLSPGHLLMTHLIDASIKQGVTGMDLLKGNYEYKSSYANQRCTTVSLTLWRSRLIAWCYRTIRQYKKS